MKTKLNIRFAPSPNGYLHLGHAYSAVFCAEMAKKLGANFIVRIEDIDKERSKDIYMEAIFDDLKWLALTWQKPVLFQSTRFEAYKKASDKLKDKGLLYPCFCSRAEIKAAALKKDPDGAPFYGGHCKKRSSDDVAKKLKAKIPHQWRLDMDKALAITGEVFYYKLEPDLIKQSTNPKAWGDVIILRKDIKTSYHLSVVVDDDFQNISHVTRGKDLEKSTDVHRVLQEILGLNAPIYIHHDLILDEDKNKLAKSKGALSLKNLREEGKNLTEIYKRIGF